MRTQTLRELLMLMARDNPKQDFWITTDGLVGGVSPDLTGQYEDGIYPILAVDSDGNRHVYHDILIDGKTPQYDWSRIIV
jgi:hypothetical protein